MPIAKPETVTAARVGQSFSATLVTGRGQVQQQFEVKAPCDDPNNGHWYCVTHRESFANQKAKDLHISDGIPHCLAWICRVHGPESPEPKPETEIHLAISLTFIESQTDEALLECFKHPDPEKQPTIQAIRASLKRLRESGFEYLPCPCGNYDETGKCNAGRKPEDDQTAPVN